MGISPLDIADLLRRGAAAILLYLFHAKKLVGALFSLRLFRTAHVSLLLGSFAGRIGSGMLPFMHACGLLQIGLGFHRFMPV